MKFHGALGDVQFAGDFLIGKIFEERVENLLLAAAQIGDRVGFETARLSGKDRIHEAGEHGARYPEAAVGDERKRADELVTSFVVGEDALYAEAKQRKAGGVLMLFADHDKASISVALENVRQQSTGGLPCRVSINDVNLSLRRLERAQIGSESGLELLADHFEFRLGQEAFELAQHQRVGREKANGQLR